MSSEYKIHISEKRAHELRRQADELNTSINKLMAQIVEDAPPPTMDAAATSFMNQLTPEHKQLILDCAIETGRTPASYILAYIVSAHDRGETAKALPETLDTTPVVEETLPNSSTCEFCHESFVPQVKGQRYCPQPADDTVESCGRKASLEAIRARRRATVVKGLPSPKIEHTVIG